jgi:hypothetical protein
MDATNAIQTVTDSGRTDWRLVLMTVAAVSGWAGFVLSLLAARRNRRQDWAEWEKAFVEYRRTHLKPFADIIRPAYGRFIEGQRNVPQTWEEAIHAARWPRCLPMPDAAPLQSWRTLYGTGMDAEDEHLFRFVETIYPSFNPSDKRPLRERSILPTDEFDRFDVARGGIADYFEACGQLRRLSRGFGRFLETKVRPNHYYKVKLAAYLELALVRVWGECSETSSGKAGLFALGSDWKTDDKRR